MGEKEKERGEREEWKSREREGERERENGKAERERVVHQVVNQTKMGSITMNIMFHSISFEDTVSNLRSANNGKK